VYEQRVAIVFDAHAMAWIAFFLEAAYRPAAREAPDERGPAAARRSGNGAAPGVSHRVTPVW
jgi:hypothetical protein